MQKLNKNFLAEYNKLNPYGEDNLAPYFLIENIKITRTKI